MIAEAETHAKEDEELRERVGARNGLEQYCYNLRNSISDNNLSEHISEEDSETLGAAVKEALEWLETEGDQATLQQIKDRQSTVEGIANPIMTRVHEAAAEAKNQGSEASDTDPSKE